jgi:hypothetical protein
MIGPWDKDRHGKLDKHHEKLRLTGGSDIIWGVVGEDDSEADPDTAGIAAATCHGRAKAFCSVVSVVARLPPDNGSNG